MQAPETTPVPNEPNRLIRLWRRLPVLVRATIAALVVVTGTGFLMALFALNQQFLPGLPWGVVLTFVLYWLYWQYLGGRWWPRATSESRRAALRANPVQGPIRTWSAVGGILGGVAVFGLYLLAMKTTALPEEVYEIPAEFRDLPLWLTLAWSWAIAIGAGFFEEAAFRGYMQGPIERRHGAMFAIVFTTIVFTALHLPQARVTAFTVIAIVAGSLLLGIMAWASRSILPGALVHAAIDCVSVPLRNFGVVPPRPFAETGVDGVLVLTLVLSVPFGIGAIWALVHLTKLRLAERE